MNQYSYKRIIKSAIVPIIMMIFTSLYSVVDGLFLSNYAGKEAFAAVGFIMPFLMLFTSTGFMFGTGSSALISKTLGENKKKDANEIFTNIVLFSVILGVILLFIAYLLLSPVITMQGANEELRNNCIKYASIYLLGIPACIVQFEFQALFSTAGKKNVGLFASVLSGLLNILLDYILLKNFNMGLTGAALASIISQYIGAIFSLIYFVNKNSSYLKLVKTKLRLKDVIKSCSNGSSEMVNNISISIVSFVYNIMLLKYGGENAISAYATMSYINFLFTAIFWGYITATAPTISYEYGAKNHANIHDLLRKSIIIICVSSITMFILSFSLSTVIPTIFVGYNKELLELTIHGFRIFSFVFLFSGLSIFLSSFFTALNNGLISAILSFTRVFLFQIPLVILLPLGLKLDGVWLSVSLAEILTILLGFFFIIKYRKKYQY